MWYAQANKNIRSSLKDLSKAINAYYSNAPTLPLPDELTQAIEAYLDKHEKFDDQTSEKLHDELQVIYNSHVAGQPSRYASFIAIFRRFVTVIRTPARLFHWWDIMGESVEMNAVQEKGLLEESAAGTMDLLMMGDVYEQENKADGAVNPFAERLYLAWMDKHRPIESSQGDESDIGGGSTERPMREGLIAWGKKKPKDFLLLIDKYFIKSEYRSRSARMLCDFIQKQPPHLHLILQTPLFGNLLRCLQHDTSTTAVSLAITTLIMILPHMPSSLVPFLPILFNIYARLLFWDNERTGTVEAASEDNDARSLTSASGWEASTFCAESDDLEIRHLASYFTILYGMYPLNFTDYIRKPQRYLRHANAAESDEVDVQPTEIRDRSERFRQSHLLHPNFYTLTIDSEKTDLGRWLNCEPAELVADCMALRVPTDTVSSELMPAAQAAGAASSFFSDGSEGLDPALLSGSGPDSNIDSWRNTQDSGRESQASSRIQSTVQRQPSQSSHLSNKDSTDTRSRGVDGDSPTLPPHLVVSSSHTHLQDMIQSNKAIKSGLHQSLANDSVPSLALSHADSFPEGLASHVPSHAPTPAPVVPSPLSLAGTQTQSAYLQRQVMLLQNDLNFERYLKQQHMAHIGELRRKQVREAASEAEAQHLILANRNLRNRLDDAKKAEMQIRKESERSRTLAKKWESDLSAKLRTLREESKKTKTTEESLRRELLSAKQEGEKLRKIVCDAEVKELNSRQNMQSVEIEAAEISRLKAEVDRLTMSERDLQAKEVERQTAMNSAAESDNRSEILDLKLASKERELEKTKKLCQSQIAALTMQLAEAREGRRPRRTVTAGDETTAEGTLAASRAKQAELQKQYTNLMRRFTVLQSQYEDGKLAVGSVTSQGRNEFPFRMEGDDGSTYSSSPVNVRSRPHRVFSDSDYLDPATSSFNTTPALDTKPSTPAPTVSTSPGTEGAGSGSNASPDQRIYGRGECMPPRLA
ncbi:Hamartin protein-domain-containing protein [Verticillium dahliae]|nr:Hamartin protein-domain-containing protein [Verticillium dahliae]